MIVGLGGCFRCKKSIISHSLTLSARPNIFDLFLLRVRFGPKPAYPDSSTYITKDGSLCSDKKITKIISKKDRKIRKPSAGQKTAKHTIIAIGKSLKAFFKFF